MGGGSFGMSRSNQSSQAEDTQIGYGSQTSESTDISRSISQALSGGQSTSTQSVAFQDIFGSLFNNASGAASRLAANAGQLGEAATQLFTGGTGFLSSLTENSAREYAENRLQGNPQLDEQIDALGSDISRFFETNINPSIRSNAVASGTLGGGRQGVAEGAAVDAQAREFTRGALDLRSADLAQRDQVAAGLMDSGNQAAAIGLDSLPGLLSMADSAAGGAELDIYSRLSQILGGPTTLTDAQSTNFSESNSQSIAEAFSRAFGENFNYGRGTSSSSGKSRAFNMSGYVGVGG